MRAGETSRKQIATFAGSAPEMGTKREEGNEGRGQGQTRGQTLCLGALAHPGRHRSFQVPGCMGTTVAPKDLGAAWKSTRAEGHQRPLLALGQGCVGEGGF